MSENQELFRDWGWIVPSRDTDHARLHTKTKWRTLMISFFKEDFNAVLVLLEAEEDVK
jgi:hypothetical protein